jgi:hypothetical protein
MAVLSRIQALTATVFLIWLFSCTENINPPVVEDQVFTIHENAPPGTIVGVVIAYDPDPDQEISFSFGQGNEDRAFLMEKSTGFITVINPEPLDYERNTEMILEVIVRDDHSSEPKESSAQISIMLEDINEFPPVMADQQFNIDENPAQGDTIGILAATDPEPQQALIFRILAGNSEDAINLEQGTGTLTVGNPEAFDHETHPQFLLSVQVRDVHLDSKADTAAITIFVNDVPE